MRNSASALAVLTCAHAACASTTPVAVPPLFFHPWSTVLAVSSDGTAAAGWSDLRSFRWMDGAQQDLGTLGGPSTQARDMSGNGNVVVGIAGATSVHGPSYAFKWENGMIIDLGSLGGTNAEASGVNNDGSVIVGTSSLNGNQVYRAVRWVNGQIQNLGTLGGGRTFALDVSADGSVVVGHSQNLEGFERAFRWADGVMTDLGSLGGTSARANAVSADGSVAVGESDMALGSLIRHACRWTPSFVQDLGTLGGARSSARAANESGDKVVGWSETPGGSRRAFLWMPSLGMVDLNVYLPSIGVDTAGWEFVTAASITPDGRVIGGTGSINGASRGFVVPLTPGACVTDLNGVGGVGTLDLFTFLERWFQQTGTSGPGLSADFDRSGTVDATDIFVFLDQWQHDMNGCGR